MVATRSGRAAKAPEVTANTANTLKAPPKRAGKRKAVEDAPAEPAAKVLKPSKAEPKKKAAPKPATKAALKAPAKTTRRTAKVVEVAQKVEEKPEPVVEPKVVEPKTTRRAVRGRKPAVATPVIEAPVAVEEPAKELDTPVVVEEPAKELDTPVVVEEPVVDISEPPKAAAKPVKPATRARKQPALKVDSRALTTATTRATRGRKAAVAIPVESPLKVPARKPGRKLAAKATPKAASKVERESVAANVVVEEPFAEYPNYPNTPSHIIAPLSSHAALKELPAGYPNTPAHISAPIPHKNAIAELPEYPETSVHITAASVTQKALEESPVASIETQSLNELPTDDSKTPTRVVAPLSSLEAFDELPNEYPKTPAHIIDAFHNHKALNELPADYPKTPAHIVDAYENRKALDQMPEYPKTPAHIADTYSNQQAFIEMPEYPKTPAHIEEALSNQKALDELPAEYPQTPAYVDAMLSNQRALDQLPDYPQTPAHIVAPLGNQAALKELPAEYPQTPVHIRAPMTIKEGLAALTSYFKTPKATEKIIQEAPLSPAQKSESTPKAVDSDNINETTFSLTLDFECTPATMKSTTVYETTSGPALKFESTPKAIETSAEESASSPIQDFESEDMSFEPTEPIKEIQPDSSLIDGSESPVVQDQARSVVEPSVALPGSNVVFAAPDMVSLEAPASPSKRSALRSPVKPDLKTPKKTVTWNDDESEPEMLLHGGPLRGMKFFVDVTSNGKDQSFLFTGLLEDMGARVERYWDQDTYLTHVLFKDGKQSTLEKAIASNGAVKCVNVGWILDSEKNKTRMDETPYLVDLDSMNALSPTRSKAAPFTPAKTPSKYLPSIQEKPGVVRSVPTTPTSSEFERSMLFDDKENSEFSFYTPQARTCPKPKFSWLMSKPAQKTPSKPDSLKQSPMKAFSTTKKRSAAQSFGGPLLAPPKKLRFF
jgi:hypothetical protein